jgi:hypothetical protein
MSVAPSEGAKMAGPDGATAPQVDGAQSSTGSHIGRAGELRELVKRFPLRQESTAKEREIAWDIEPHARGGKRRCRTVDQRLVGT